MFIDDYNFILETSNRFTNLLVTISVCYFMTCHNSYLFEIEECHCTYSVWSAMSTKYKVRKTEKRKKKNKKIKKKRKGDGRK